MAKTSIELLYVTDRTQWRRWLVLHHKDSVEIWLVFFKRHTGKPSIPYDVAVEEALCFGWVDSLIRRLDNDRYARKFTPRRPRSAWSEVNKKRAERMIATGRMMPAGQVLIDQAKASAIWDHVQRLPAVSADTVPEELRVALSGEPQAAATFDALPATYRRQYVLWIATAKKPETRTHRAAEAVRKLRRGERLGLK